MVFTLTHVRIDEYSGDIPVFARLRKVDAPPSVIPRVAGYEFAKFGGIPLIAKGFATVTYRYSIDLLCDVCNKKVDYKKIHHGVPGEVPRTEAERMVAAEKKTRQAIAVGKEISWPARDDELVKNLAREINLHKHFRLQCPKCGRWVGRGREHAECFDDRWGLCRFCGKTMEKLLEKQKEK